MKRFLPLLALVLVFLCSAAAAETWQCRKCSTTNSNRLYCSSCGTPKLLPNSIDVIKWQKSGMKEDLSVRTGPGTNYTEIATFHKEDIQKLYICVKEAGSTATWVMIDIRCFAGRYRCYTGLKRFDVNGNKLTTGSYVPYQVTTTSSATAYYGPGTDYVVYGTIPAGTSLKALCSESGYICTEFYSGSQLCRAWISAEYLSGY